MVALSSFSACGTCVAKLDAKTVGPAVSIRVQEGGTFGRRGTQGCGSWLVGGKRGVGSGEGREAGGERGDVGGEGGIGIKELL